MAFRKVSERWMRLLNRDIEREEEELKLIYGASKQILHKLPGARHGLEPNRIGEVKRELRTLIEAVKDSDRTAKHAERVWGRMKGEARELARTLDRDFKRIEDYDATVLEYLLEIHRRLDAWDRQGIRELIGAIESLQDFSNKLHTELHDHILRRQIPGHEDIAYRPHQA